ncbi:MAG: ribonuclease D [Candidatus Methylomirabilales bacterium]
MSDSTSDPTAPIPPRWVRRPEELQALAARLAHARAVAVDTESNSLYHFPEQVCLVQLAEEDGTISLVDPLALPDLSALAPTFASPTAVKVLHGAAYDVSSLKRDFGFQFARIFDSMVAAQFLGLPELGLSALVERYFGVAPGRSRQKDDWTARPLTPEQERYAADDVRYLLPLRRRLAGELAARGREAWVEEECEALAALLPAERVFDPDDALRLKGASLLDRRGLAALRELFAAREAWARATGRPPFRVLGNDTLLRLAQERPRTLAALGKIPGCTPRCVDRCGAGILAAIRQAESLPEDALPTPARPRKPRIPPAVERRLAALNAWRAEAAPRAGLDPGLLLPRRLMEVLAEAPPASPAGLAAVPGLRRWRVEHFGKEILQALEA